MGKNRTKVDAGEGRSGSGRSASTTKLDHPWGVLSPQARLFEVVLHMGFECVWSCWKRIASASADLAGVGSRIARPTGTGMTRAAWSTAAGQ